MKRRANNEGSIYQRKNGYWVVEMSVDGKQKPLYCKSEDEAVALLKELHSQQILGKKIFASDEPFGVYLLRWLAETKIGMVRRNTWEDYSAIAKNHIIPVIGDMRICDIKTSDIQSLYNDMAASGSSPQIIRKTHVVLSMVFKSMLPDQLIDRLPTVGTIRPRIQKSKKLLFTAEQEQKFLETVNSSTSQFKALFTVYSEVGGRISEILGLKWDSVFDDHILIENVRVQVSGGSMDADPKTDASMRKVYLSPECMAVIKQQHRKPFKEEKDRTILSDYVFATTTGKPHTNRNWRRQWDNWLIQAFGIDTEKSKYICDDNGKAKLKYPVPALRITPHALRHMSAVHFFEQGYTVADVQIRGGWDSPKVLQEIYAAHSSEDRQRMMAQVARNRTTVKTTVNEEKPSS